MRTSFARRIKWALSKLYLDLAERYYQPGRTADSMEFIKEFDEYNEKRKYIRAALAYLRYNRAREREDAEENYNRTRGPEDVSAQLLLLRSFEMFHVEDFQRLQKGIVKLFPSITKSFMYEEGFDYQFQNFSSSFRSSSWMSLGIIYLSRERMLLGHSVYRIIDGIPIEIDYVDVVLHKVLPSVYMVSFDMHVGKRGNEQLLHLQNQRYLSKVYFESVNPLRLAYKGGTGSTSEREMEEVLGKWVDELRGSVELALRPFFSGFFTERNIDRKVRLPAIEVYSLKGTPLDDDKFNAWKQKYHNWLSSMNINLGYNSYGSEKIQFSWTSSSWRDERLSNYFVVFPESYLRNRDIRMYHSEEYAIKRTILEYTKPLMLYLLVVRFYNCIEKEVDAVRSSVVGTIRRRKGMRALSKQNDLLFRTAMLFDRVSGEFTVTAKQRWHSLHWYSDLKQIWQGEIEGSLDKDIVDFVERKHKSIESQIKHLENWFSKYMSSRNIEISYFIQIIVICLTILTIIIGLLAIDWGETCTNLQNWISTIPCPAQKSS